MFAWRRRVKIHLEQLEERVARLEAEMDHVAIRKECRCGKSDSKPGMTKPFGGDIEVNPKNFETRWTCGPNWKADRP